MRISAFVAVALFAAAPALAASMPMDTPTDIGSVNAVCTGVGSAENDPRWTAYPVRVVFSNGGAQFLSGVHLTLNQDGKTLATVDCDGPWVLLKLPKGDYRVTATLTGQPGGKPHSADFSTSGMGAQQRVEIQFPKVEANQ